MEQIGPFHSVVISQGKAAPDSAQAMHSTYLLSSVCNSFLLLFQWSLNSFFFLSFFFLFLSSLLPPFLPPFFFFLSSPLPPFLPPSRLIFNSWPGPPAAETHGDTKLMTLKGSSSVRGTDIKECMTCFVLGVVIRGKCGYNEDRKEE